MAMYRIDGEQEMAEKEIRLIEFEELKDEIMEIIDDNDYLDIDKLDLIREALNEHHQELLIHRRSLSLEYEAYKGN